MIKGSKHTKESRKKIKIARAKQKTTNSETMKRLFKEGKFNPNIKRGWFKKGEISKRKGIKLSDETKKKIGLARAKQKTTNSKTMKELYKEGKIVPWNKGLNGYKNPKSSETKKRKFKEGKLIVWNKGKKGYKAKEKHYNWKGGISFEPYGLEFNKTLKALIRKRDNHTCQECNWTQQMLGYTLIVHHIDYNKRNNNPENLISLCRSCHTKTNFKREDWIEHFNNKIGGASV